MKTKKQENLITPEKVDIYKISDSLEYRRALARNDIEAIKNLAKVHFVKHNVVPKTGREQLGKILTKHCSWQASDDDAETWINYCAIGTSDTAHTENSTKLHSESFRKLVASGSYSSNIFKTTSHYLPDDCDGSFREEEVVIEGTDVADSGVAFSIISLSSAEGNKSDSEALLIERTFTISIS